MFIHNLEKHDLMEVDSEIKKSLKKDGNVPWM